MCTVQSKKNLHDVSSGPFLYLSLHRPAHCSVQLKKNLDQDFSTGPAQYWGLAWSSCNEPRRKITSKQIFPKPWFYHIPANPLACLKCFTFVLHKLLGLFPNFVQTACVFSLLHYHIPAIFTSSQATCARVQTKTGCTEARVRRGYCQASGCHQRLIVCVKV